MRLIASFTALLIAALPLAAFAQTDRVEVDGTETLTGLWKVSFPGGISACMPGRGRLVSAGVESFCRLQQTGAHVSAICLPGWGPDSEDGELDGKNLHLAWGTSLLRTVIDTKIESASVQAFQGVFAVKIFGDRHDAPTPASARKLVLGAPDAAGKAKLLTQTLEELAAGVIVTPHVAEIALNFGPGDTGYKPNTAGEIRGLGKVEAVLYLGEGSTVRPRLSEVNSHTILPFSIFAFSAYQVEFTNGERLCGIHQREDGMLDGFVCV